MPGVKLPEPDSDEEEDNTPAPLVSVWWRGGNCDQIGGGLCLFVVRLCAGVACTPPQAAAAPQQLQERLAPFSSCLCSLLLMHRIAPGCHGRSAFDLRHMS